jgi:dTDP-4-dehydrorhamnose 3,5-epimerase
MELETSPLPGVYSFAPDLIEDRRGYFYESYSPRLLDALGSRPSFVQENVSRSRRDVVRGLHYQIEPTAQGKLIRAVLGEVFDVCVDLRKGSPTFGRWHATTLSAENRRRLWAPPGLAHGFCVVSDVAEVVYSVTAPYAPALERTVLWSDPALAIPWPVLPERAVLSAKDAAACPLAQAETNFVL